MPCLCEQMAGPEMELAPMCLGRLWLFQDVGPEDLQALLAAAQRRRWARGETIFSQGQAARSMFLIKAGRVKLSKVDEDGREFTLDLRGAGDFLGESMLGEASEFPLSAVCLEDSLTCGFSKPAFEELVRGHPNLGLVVIKNLSRRVDQLTSRVGSMSLSNLEEKLYQVLAQVAAEHGEPGPGGLRLSMPLTHEELSFLVGAHRVSITRALKGLRNSGRVIQQGRELIVRPREAA